MFTPCLHALSRKVGAGRHPRGNCGGTSLSAPCVRTKGGRDLTYANSPWLLLRRAMGAWCDRAAVNAHRRRGSNELQELQTFVKRVKVKTLHQQPHLRNHEGPRDQFSGPAEACGPWAQPARISSDRQGLGINHRHFKSSGDGARIDEVMAYEGGGVRRELPRAHPTSHESRLGDTDRGHVPLSVTRGVSPQCH